MGGRRSSAHERTMACEDCRLDFVTVAYNAKLDHLCRLLRDLKFLDKGGSAIKSCRGCDKRYARSHAKDYYCAECDDHGRIVPGTCILCDDESSYLHHETVPVCRGCLKDRDMRMELIQWLTRERRWRYANPATAERKARWQHACVVAVKAGEDPPPMPDDLATRTRAQSGWPDTEPEDPDEGERWRAAVRRSCMGATPKLVARWESGPPHLFVFDDGTCGFEDHGRPYRTLRLDDAVACADGLMDFATEGGGLVQVRKITAFLREQEPPPAAERPAPQMPVSGPKFNPEPPIHPTTPTEDEEPETWYPPTGGPGIVLTTMTPSSSTTKRGRAAGTADPMAHEESAS